MNKITFRFSKLALVFALLFSSAICSAEPIPEIVADASDGLQNPFGITFDSKQNAYIVEYEGGRIFLLKPGGKPKLFAGATKKGFAGDGGPAKNAVFNGMHNGVCTANDQLYISDTRSNRIRKINLNSGQIETISGNGKKGYNGDARSAFSAQLNDPISIALTPKSNELLIADINNRRIRSINLKTGIIQTVAGNGKRGIPDENGIATKNPLLDPRACDVDSKGNLYILERGGHALRRVSPEGKIKTVAGTGKAGSKDGSALQASMKGPKHICIDSQDRVIIADAENHLIRRYDPKENSLTTLLGRKIKLKRPHGVTIHNGWLYICDSYNNRVLRIKQ